MLRHVWYVCDNEILVNGNDHGGLCQEVIKKCGDGRWLVMLIDEANAVPRSASILVRIASSLVFTKRVCPAAARIGQGIAFNRL